MQLLDLDQLFSILDEKYGQVEPFLNHKNEFELLVAVILSAQTTDVLVNRVTPALFEKYPTALELAQAEYTEVAQLIGQVNYFRNKAKFLIGMAKILTEQYGGAVPRTLDELVRLPGVGRKVANVLMADEFGVTEGVVVDTHVKRVVFRLGLTVQTEPEKVEKDLMKVIPGERWKNLPKQLILIGREYCYGGRPPNCKDCPLRSICPKVGVVES